MARVKCECCTFQVDEDNAIQQIDETYLCVSCDREQWEEAEEKWEAEEELEIVRAMRSYDRYHEEG